jgi:hypothetical protein
METIRVTPEKDSNPRIFRVSNKLLNMLVNVKRNNNVTDPKRVFAKGLRTIAKGILKAACQHLKEATESKVEPNYVPYFQTRARG